MRAHPGPLHLLPSLDEPAEDDAALAAAFRTDPLAALARAFDRWHERVRVLARRLLWDDAAAEDVVQEVFTALPRAARAFRGEVALEAFVLAIAVKRARHHQRAAVRRRRVLATLARPTPFGERDPERELYRRELADRLARALDRLPHDQRVAFVLCEIEGLTAGEAAAIAGAPEPTVRTRLFHARRKLRDLLARERAE
jgi:RNA polymerase sigma-70 factor, ECF subfamily